MVHSAAGDARCRGRAGHAPAVPGAAPHQLHVALVGGGSATLRPGEISLEPRRRPVPRRARRVPAGRARRAARAAGGGRHPGRSGRTPAPCCRPASCSSRRPTRARAAAGRRARASATTSARLRYLRRLSGPLLDRFDLRVAVHRPAVDELLDAGGGEPSAVVAGAGRRGPDRRARPGPGGSTPSSTASCSTYVAALDAGRAGRCCAPRSSAIGSPGAATTASAGSLARSPTCTPTPGGAPVEGAIDVEHVRVALSLRTRLRAATPGLVA